MELHLKISGTLLIVLAIVHIAFPKYFNWKEEFVSLSLINRQMIYVHTFFIALIVFLMGALCISSADDIEKTVLGKNMAAGCCIFWATRLLIQFFGYSARLWKGKTFETVVHLLFILLWTYLAVVFLVVYIE